MWRNSFTSIGTVILIVLLMVILMFFSNQRLQPIFVENEEETRLEFAATALPSGEDFSSYIGEPIVGINHCYIETNGFGMIAESAISVTNQELTVFVGINQEGYIAGVKIYGENFKNSILSDIIDEEYLAKYIGVNEINENSIENDVRFPAREEALELSESIYQTAKLALSQYGEIYE